MSEPCGNPDCDLCHPLPRWVISTERTVRRVHEREIKAATAEEALRIYEEGTAWPSDYDEHDVEVLEEKPSAIKTLAEAHPIQFETHARLTADGMWCWHKLDAPDVLEPDE